MVQHSASLFNALVDNDHEKIDLLYKEYGSRVNFLEFSKFTDLYLNETSREKYNELQWFLRGIRYMMMKYGDDALCVQFDDFSEHMATFFYNFVTFYDMYDLLLMALDHPRLKNFIDTPHATNDGGWVPIHSCCLNGSQRGALLLLERGCDWRIRNCVGASLLWVISQYDFMNELVVALLARGADPLERFVNHESCVAHAIVGNATKNVQTFFSSALVDGECLLGDRVENRATITMLAAACGNMGAMKLCLEFEGALSVASTYKDCDEDGVGVSDTRVSRTAVEYAIAFQQWECAASMLELCFEKNVLQVSGYLFKLFTDFTFYGSAPDSLDGMEALCRQFMSLGEWKCMLSSSNCRFMNSDITPLQLLIEGRNTFKSTPEQRHWMKYFNIPMPERVA